MLAATVREVFESAERNTSQIPAHLVDELMLLASWFKQRPSEKRRTADFDKPLPRAAAVLC